MRPVNEFKMNKTFCLNAGAFEDLKLIDAALRDTYGSAKVTSLIAFAYDAVTERYVVRIMNRETLEIADVQYEIDHARGRAVERYFLTIHAGTTIQRDCADR